ncbi:mevalonate kinase [Neobacillus sp. MM2021_6]|uniref:mevalonate kinase n=1 Tax=Bacillaceae TaxID=186817 RepID=UPI00140E1CED|nr:MULTISPECIES: mevalonate kinase [Bacillaceae]MBO0961400.1 mevalonate kinase [Neobacillus sp. MM2021_6]NHC20441.1 mevalonate kinase [Bacillus sp. MM2020_4]
MRQLMQKVAVGSAHGKLILVGEHSVVYGMPAIALPFPVLEATATVEENFEGIFLASDYYDGPLKGVPKKFWGIAACVEETLKLLNKHNQGLLIRLHSSIPIGRGLGSSAAIAIAIVKSLFAFYGKKAQPDEVMPLVHIAETFAHGNPSGLDMVTAFSEYPIWFQKGKKIESLQMGGPLFLVVADTGHFGDTRGAVLSIKAKHAANPERTQKSLNQLGTVTLEARRAISKGDLRLLGQLFDLAQSELTDLGVSNEKINRLVEAARKAGALGAKLTGGGRGGCIVALAQTATHAQVIAKALMKAGACNTWSFVQMTRGAEIN